MIIIDKVYIKKEEDITKLVCNYSINDIEKEIYIGVEHEYSKYLCHTRADAFIIVLFYWAMRNNYNIKSLIPISEDLYYQIKEYLMPIFYKNSNNELYNINISTKIGKNIKGIGGVGAGLTCGVDSFHSIYNNINTEYKSRNITHLTIMSLADSYKKNDYNDITNNIYNKAEIVSKELGLPLIKIYSNIRETIPIPPMHTLLRISSVYALQKLFSVYYFASGFPVWTFNINDTIKTDCARYDLLLTSNLSTKYLVIYSEGCSKSRLDKIKYIVDNNIVKNNLHVCIEEGYNCCKCTKCIRTMCALDSINKLEEYNNVFDIEYYCNNIDYYITEIIKLYNDKDLFIYEFIDLFVDKYKDNSIIKSFKKFRNKISICSECYRISDYK